MYACIQYIVFWCSYKFGLKYLLKKRTFMDKKIDIDSKPSYLEEFNTYPVRLLHFNDKFCQEIGKAKSAKEQIGFIIHRLITETENIFFFSKGIPYNDFNKSEQISAHFRKLGNQLLITEDYQKVIELYTRSISTAPSNSRGLAMALGNRSSVLYDMSKFKESISDVEHALKLDYPELLQHQLIFRLSQCYKQLNVPKKSKEFYDLAKTNVQNLLPSGSKKTEVLEKMCRLRALPLIEYDSGSLSKVIQVPTLNSAPSNEAPCASNAVAIRFNKEFGRHLVATKDIDIGDVLVVEEPFAAVMDQTCWYTHCTHCLQRCDNPIPCNDCSWAMFCGPQCREVALQAYHREECPVVRRYCSLMSSPPCQRMLLAIRTVATVGINNLSNFVNLVTDRDDKDIEACRTSGFNEKHKLVSSFESVLSLTGDIPKPTHHVVPECLLALTLLKLFDVFLDMEDEATLNLAALAHKLNRILFYNTSAVEDTLINREVLVSNIMVKRTGLSLNVVTSLINHSCVPNVTILNYGRNKVVRAKRPIKSGTQIMTSYGVLFCDPKEARQAHLLQFFGFKCQCEACLDWPTELPRFIEFTPNEKALKKKLQRAISVMVEKIQEGGIIGNDQDFNLFKNYIRLLIRHGKWKNKIYFCIEQLIDYYHLNTGNLYYFLYILRNS